MEKVSVTTARENISELINRAAFGNERAVFTRQQKEVAALVPMSDLALLNELERLIDVEEAKKAIEEGKEKGMITLDDLRKDLGV